MDGARLHVLAFMLSVIIGAAIQQVFMSVVLGGQAWSALVPLLAAIVVLSTLYAFVDRCGKTSRALDMTTAGLLATMLILGAASLVVGEIESSPGIGGNIVMLLALFAVVGFLLPCAIAVVIHWWLLRRRWRTQVA